MTKFEDFDRTKGVGASEVSAILGQSPYASEVSVWMEKVGLPVPRRETASMRTGTALEGAVLGIASEATNRKMVRNRVTFLHPDWPDVPLFGTPDGFTRARYGVAEVKVVGHHWDEWREGPPPHVRTQVMAQMAVIPKAAYGVVIALLGSEVKTYEVDRDEAMVEAIEEDVRAFWRDYVVPEVAPPAESPEDRWAVARLIVARLGPARVERIADDDEEVRAARLIALMESRDEVGRAIEAYRLDLGERAADGDVTGSRWKGSWGERKNTDWAALAHELGARSGDIERHTTTTKVFTFRRSKTTEETTT